MNSDNLNDYISVQSKTLFAQNKPSEDFNLPPVYANNVDDLNKTDNEASRNFKENFNSITRDFMFNTYQQKEHLYNFRVIIRPASWTEALSYNAFPITNYLVIMIVMLGIISLSFTLLFIAIYFKKFRDKLPFKIKPFEEKDVKNFLFINILSKYGSILTLLICLLKDIIKVICTLGIPVAIALGYLIYFFALSPFFENIANRFDMLQNAESVQDKELFRLNNKLSRLGLSFFLFGSYLFYTGIYTVIPSYNSNLVQKELISKENIRQRKSERTSLIFKFTFLILILIVYGLILSNLYKLSLLVYTIAFLIFLLIISPLVEKFFFDGEYLVYFAVKNILAQALLSYMINIKEINLILIIHFIAQILKYLKFFFIMKIFYIYNRLFDYIFNKSDTDKMKDNIEISYIKIPIINKYYQREYTITNESIEKLIFIANELFVVFVSIFNLGMVIFLQYLNESQATYSTFNLIFMVMIFFLSFILDFYNFYLILRGNAIIYGNLNFK